MGSFFGFLDEGFRTYDFYIGMLDAWMFLEDFQAREKTKLISSVRDNEKWWPFKCLKNFMLTKKYSDECDNLDSGKVVTTEYANMQKLFQLSLVLLYDRCIQNTERSSG